jgi:hypothetical protein
MATTTPALGESKRCLSRLSTSEPGVRLLSEARFPRALLKRLIMKLVAARTAKSRATAGQAVRGVDAQRLGVSLPRLPEATQPLQHEAEIRVRSGVAGPKADRRPISGFSVLEAVKAVEARPFEIPKLRVGRRTPEAFLGARQCRRRLPQTRLATCQTAPGSRVVGATAQRPLEYGHGRRAVSFAGQSARLVPEQPGGVADQENRNQTYARFQKG